MEITITEEDYNGEMYTATLSDYTNKRYANYNFRITWWWATEKAAKENLINKAKEMIEDIRYFDNQLKSHYKNIETNFVLFADETHTTVVSAMISRCMWYLYKKK